MNPVLPSGNVTFSPAGISTAGQSRTKVTGSFCEWYMRYSVVTLLAVSSATADFSACQPRLAHFTRDGYSRTPPSAASLSSSAAGS